uniref:Uncharacterized protein n=1 Tax=Schistocephalus solidus TaxID=70667 RepID=A0A0X3Q3E2_SCHSO
MIYAKSKRVAFLYLWVAAVRRMPDLVDRLHWEFPKLLYNVRILVPADTNIHSCLRYLRVTTLEPNDTTVKKFPSNDRKDHGFPIYTLSSPIYCRTHSSRFALWPTLELSQRLVV